MKVTATCCLVYIALGMMTSGVVFSLASWFAPPINVYVGRMRVVGPSLFGSGSVLILLMCLCCFLRQHDCVSGCNDSLSDERRGSTSSSERDAALDLKHANEPLDISLNCPQCREYLAANSFDSRKMSDARTPKATPHTPRARENVWEKLQEQDADGIQCDYPLYPCSCGQCQSTSPTVSGHVAPRRDSMQRARAGRTVSESNASEVFAAGNNNSSTANQVHESAFVERKPLLRETKQVLAPDQVTAPRIRPVSFYAPVPVKFNEHLSRSRSFTQLQAPVADFSTVVYPVAVYQHAPAFTPVPPPAYFLQNGVVHPHFLDSTDNTPQWDDGQYFEASVWFEVKLFILVCE